VPNGAPWTDELAREPAVRRLVRALSLSQRFHFFYIVMCKAPVVADAVLDLVVKETAEARGGTPVIRRIDPYARHDDFTRPMTPAKLIADGMEELLREGRADDPAISALDATLASPDDDGAWERLFARMNEHRDAIVKAMPRELILLLPPRLEDTFKKEAPDFWSIRSGEYEVNALPPAGSALEMAPPQEKVVAIYQMVDKRRYREAAQAALEVGNTALRNREGGVALWAFRWLDGIATAFFAEANPKQPEDIELAERAGLGAGRSRLLMGDVVGAEEAWREARKEARSSSEEQGQRSNLRSSQAPPPLVESSRPYNVLIAHALEDERYVRELERHLRGLERNKTIRITHGGRINIGESWDRAIDERLQHADVVLLMISPDFLSSERAMREIRSALQTAAERGTRVFPVLLRPVVYEAIGELAGLQPSPKNGIPISEWPRRDEAWSEVTRDIRRTLDSLSSRKR